MSSNKNRKQNLVSKKGMDNDFFSAEVKEYQYDFRTYVKDLTTILKISYEKFSSYRNQPIIKYKEHLKEDHRDNLIVERHNAYESVNELEILNRSLFISQMSSFERIRNKNLKLSASTNKKIQDKIIEAFLDLPPALDADGSLKKIFKKRDKINEFVDKYPHGLFKLEKSVYEIYKLTKKSDEIKKVLDLFLIHRELRNLIVHRSKVIDDKVLKSLKTSGSFNPPKTIDELSGRASIRQEEDGKSPLTIHFVSIINCHFNILKLSFLYFSIGFKEKLEELEKVDKKNEKLRFLSITLAKILNETLCFTIKIKEGFLKSQLLVQTMRFVTFCLDFCRKGIGVDDIFSVNLFLLVNAIKRSFYDPKDYKKLKFDRFDKSPGIQDKLIKAIVENFKANDIDNFVINVEKYWKREKKNHNYDTPLNNWYMIQVFIKEPSVERLLRSIESKKILEKTKKD